MITIALLIYTLIGLYVLSTIMNHNMNNNEISLWFDYGYIGKILFVVLVSLLSVAWPVTIIYGIFVKN